jgi:hypothetical protein
MSRFGKKSEDKGVGDTIARFTRLTKIDKAVKAVAGAVGIEDCGCCGRQSSLNKKFPYKR